MGGVICWESIARGLLTQCSKVLEGFSPEVSSNLELGKNTKENYGKNIF